MKRAHHLQLRAAAAQMHAFAAVQREIRSRDSAAGSKYLRNFNNAFRSYERVLTAAELDQRVAAASILLVGDYHALPTSQGFAANLLERLSQRMPVVLCVETVLSRDQSILDSWWRREISKDDLRRHLRFDDEWGYGWEPFYALLISAREHSEGVYGLDCPPRDDLRRIRSRDRHAVKNICEIRRQHPAAIILVLFGESHMAPQHIPAVLSRMLPRERILILLQNLESIYWQAIEERAHAVDLGGGAVCVFNSSPLEKFENYRVALETWNAAPDEPPDFAPTVYNLILSLARTLGFRLNSPPHRTHPKPLEDSLPEVITVEDSAEELFAPAKLAAELVGSGPLRSRLEQVRSDTVKRLEQNGCVYVAAANRFYVRELHMPRIAAEAARFLRHVCCGRGEGPQSDPLEHVLAHFGARLLCPGASAGSENDVNPEGEVLYRAYIEGRISETEVRDLFLARPERVNHSAPTSLKLQS
jgi:Haem-binding uptake, Tiki superfamily, ChaN